MDLGDCWSDRPVPALPRQSGGKLPLGVDWYAGWLSPSGMDGWYISRWRVRLGLFVDNVVLMWGLRMTSPHSPFSNNLQFFREMSRRSHSQSSRAFLGLWTRLQSFWRYTLRFFPTLALALRCAMVVLLVSPDDCSAESVFLDNQVFRIAALFGRSRCWTAINNFHWISHGLRSRRQSRGCVGRRRGTRIGRRGRYVRNVGVPGSCRGSGRG